MAISKTALSGEALECESHSSICEKPLVYAVGLPWRTLLELMEEEGGTYYVDLIETAGAGWHIECMDFIPLNESGTGEIVSKVENEANGTVDAFYKDAFGELAGYKLFLFTGSNEDTGLVEGLEIISLVNGGTLAASS